MMGSIELSTLLSSKKRPYSKTHAKRVLRLAIKEYKQMMTRKQLDDKKGGVVGRYKFYNWGFDKLSAEIAWVGMVRQEQVIAEYYIRRIDAVGLKRAQNEFEKAWGAKHKNKRDKQEQKELDDLFYRFNEHTEGLMRSDQ
tara:strand:+ start:3934 stop:4353 length:420 start_codon:yes stop_codon:yes gene_type:complete